MADPMLTPSNSELISVWERGVREHPVDRALTLLCACSEESREDLAPLGKSVHADALAHITWFLAGLLEKCRR